MNTLWRFLKLIGLGFLTSIGLVIIWLVFANVQANARLGRNLDALRAAGQPLSLAELAREPISPETNAATYLRRAESDLKAIEKEVSAAIEATPQDEQDAFYESYGGHASPEILIAFRSAVDAYPDVYPLLERASQCPDFDPQIDYTVDVDALFDELTPALHQARMANRYLSYRVRVLLADGRNAEALETCLVMLRLCRHFDRSPMIVSYLVALAMRSVAVDVTSRVLRAGPLSDDAYQRLEVELARHDVIAAYRQALVGARVDGIQYFRDKRTGSFGFRVFPHTFKHDQCDYLELIDESIRSADLPYSESDAWAGVTTLPMQSRTLTQLIAPTIQATANVKCRVQAQLRCLRILNAIVRRDQAGDQTEPELAALGLPADVLEDPYSGESLLVKKLPDGWVIYSVGQKLTDGGGTNLGGQSDQDVGLGPLWTVENADADK